MSLERKFVPYESEKDSILQDFLSFISVQLSEYANDFLKFGRPRDYIFFLRRLDASTKEEKQQLKPLIQAIQKKSDLSPQDWVLLGHACENGIDFKINEERATKNFEKGGEIGCFALGRMLLNKQERADQWRQLAYNYTGYYQGNPEEKLKNEFKIKAAQEGKNLAERALSVLAKINLSTNINHNTRLFIAETHFLMFDAYSKMAGSPEIYQLMQQCHNEALENGCPRVHDIMIESDDYRTLITHDVYEYKPKLIAQLERAASAGCVKEFHSLAKIMYSHGDHQCHIQRTFTLCDTPEDLQKKKIIKNFLPEYVRARIYCEVLANLGNINVLGLLAEAMSFGNGIEEDRLKVAKTCRLAAGKSLIDRENSPYALIKIEDLNQDFLHTEHHIKDQVKASPGEKIELIYHSLLGLHACRLWQKKEDGIRKTAAHFNYFVTEHEDAVVALIQSQDIPSLKRILKADMAARLEAKHQIQLNSLKNVLCVGKNKFPEVLENVILDFAGIPHTFFGAVKKPVSEIKDVEMKLDDEEVRQPPAKKRRVSLCSRICQRN